MSKNYQVPRIIISPVSKTSVIVSSTAIGNGSNFEGDSDWFNNDEDLNTLDNGL